MNSDWVDALAFSSAFLPYWKTAVKSVLSHSASLSLGLVAFLTAKAIQGGAAMNRAESKKPEWFDYGIAHPLALPFWVWVLGSIFTTFDLAGGWYLLIPSLLCGAWLSFYFPAHIRILEYQRAEEKTELFVPSRKAAA